MENNKITKKPDGLSLDVDNENVKNSIKILNQTTFDSLLDPENVLFEKLIHPNRQDVLGLLQIYGLCFSNYGLLLDREFILKKAEETIIYVARNKRGEIIATARGKFLEEESLFFFRNIRGSRTY